MATSKNKRIAIVGGGPGGLTLARILQMNGANVKVYERDGHKDARATGATLDLHHGSGLAALQEAGLMDKFRLNYRPKAGNMRVLDRAATIRFDDSINGEEGFHRPEIDRGPLNDILYNSLEPETVVWNSQFVSLIREANLLRLEFKNGSFAVADIVIAADGANSKLRPYITALKPVYSGNTIVEGTVYDAATTTPKMHELLNGGKIFAFGNSKSLIVSSKGDGSLIFYTGCNTNEAWSHESGINFSDKSQVSAWFQKEYAGWDTAWLELFENADGPFIPRPQYCMPFNKEWDTLPNLTMIGDAAHVMPPYAGEGVNMAMLDALELSQCLCSDEFDNVQSAIAVFEKQMRARIADIGRLSMDNTTWMHSENALSIILEFFNKIKARQMADN